jgi:hypothetical protein
VPGPKTVLLHPTDGRRARSTHRAVFQSARPDARSNARFCLPATMRGKSKPDKPPAGVIGAPVQRNTAIGRAFRARFGRGEKNIKAILNPTVLLGDQSITKGM